MAKNPETTFKEKVQTDLKGLGSIYFVKIQQVAIRGTPDILACYRGKFIALELKKDDVEQPTERQLYELKKIQKAGGMALVVSPSIWPSVFELIKYAFK